jgi:SET domain-containing protein
MLMVNASKGPSKIHGHGLIAREFIPDGTVVWRLVPGFDLVIGEEQFSTLSAAAQEQVLFYAYWDERRRSYVLSSDDDRFTNHSEVANTADYPTDPDRPFALRDILPGEEIAWDYSRWVTKGQQRDILRRIETSFLLPSDTRMALRSPQVEIW